MTEIDVPEHASTKRGRGRPPKTAEQRDDGNRRRDLVRAAAKLFRQQGYEATTTRDIAAAVGMQSGSPFYHFGSKADLLVAVMEDGMRDGLARVQATVAAHQQHDAVAQLRALMRTHLDVLWGPGSDFIPVMLQEWRVLKPSQTKGINALKDAYEGHWTPVLKALKRQGRLRGEVGLIRLFLFGALNWSIKWFDARGSASLDELTDAAVLMWLHDAPDPQVGGGKDGTV